MPELDLDKPHDQTQAIKELAELLRHAIEMIVKHLRFEQAAVFLLNDAEDFAVLQASSCAIEGFKNPNDYRLPTDPSSLVGWVATHNQSRVITDANQEFSFEKSDLFPSSSCEAGIPISWNGKLLGVLHVQHYQSEAFDTDALATLQSIANLLATFTYQHKIFEATQIKLTAARQQAERERVASEIAAKLWSSTDIDTILRTAIHELSQHLEADEGIIQLKLPKDLQIITTPANNGHKGGKA